MIEITLIAIMNQTTKKTIGVFLHDFGSGRVLLKTRPSDASLMQTFTVWREKPLIEVSREIIRGRKLTRRYRILPTNPVYGRALVDKFVKSPYAVRTIMTIKVDSLDAALDHSFKELVDHAPARPAAPPAVAINRSPFSSNSPW